MGLIVIRLGAAGTLTSPHTPPRRAARYPFVAKVALGEPGSSIRVVGLTTDLSEGGCGVRAQELFARGTTVELEITKNSESFRAAALVVYGLPPNVMGLSFTDVSAAQKSVLAGWIARAIPTLRRGTAERELPFSDADRLASPGEPNKSS